MNRRSRLPSVAVLPGVALAILGLALGLHTLGPSVARGAPAASASSSYPTVKSPKATPRSSASAGALPSAAAAEPAVSRFDLPPIAKEAIPKDRSDPPTSAEWKTARLVEVTRRSPAARDCRAYLVREYLKVHCGMPLAGLRQLAGNNKDTSLFVFPKAMDKPFTDPPNGGEAIFPLRRGEGHLFQFFDLNAEYEGFSPGPSVVVDASWPDGLDAPSVVLR